MSPRFSDKLSAPKVSVSGQPLPTARVVSRTIHPDEGLHEHAGTVMLVAWGQFMDHDLTLTATPLGKWNYDFDDFFFFILLPIYIVCRVSTQIRWTGTNPRSVAVVRITWRTNTATRSKYRKTTTFTGTTTSGVKTLCELFRASSPTVNWVSTWQAYNLIWTIRHRSQID